MTEIQIMEQIRAALAGVAVKKEQKMFGKRAFLVHDKLCLAVGKEELMIRFDPKQHDRVLQNHPCQPVQMGGRSYKGYVYVAVEKVADPAALTFWIDLALAFNDKLVNGNK